MLRLPCELVLTESFAPADRQIARERMDLALRRLRSADEEAVAERARDARRARRARRRRGRVRRPSPQPCWSARATLPSSTTAMATASAALADTGAIAVREDVNLEPAFWGQFPGNEAYIVRRALISTANMAGFGSLHGFPLGQATGNHWGDAVTLLETTSSTPFFFNFHDGDLGNFSVIGPSGSGKTVVLNFLAAQAQKFGPRTIFFDKDRGAEMFIRGDRRALRPHRRRASRPASTRCALPEHGRATAPSCATGSACCSRPKGRRSWRSIAAAVDAAYDQRSGASAGCAISASCSAAAAARSRATSPAALDPWIDNGEHGWLFDNDEDRLDLTLAHRSAST